MAAFDGPAKAGRYVLLSNAGRYVLLSNAGRYALLHVDV